MADANQQTELLELANHYPSPHNGQPIRLKAVGDGRYELYFETKRGLQAAEVSYLFSFVTMGVFLTHLGYCAEALGHGYNYQLDLLPVSALKSDGLVRFASCTIEWNARPADDQLKQALLFRQTSRKKYYAGIDEPLAETAVQTARDHGMQLVKMDRAGTKQAIWLNQRAVFDDMFDDAVRHELDHWLRYSRHEKEAKRDGLSYDCMELNGRLMKFIVRHYKLLRAPGISRVLQEYYLRTMTDNSDVFYMLTPFATEQQAFDVGVVIMQVWKAGAEHGYYFHPFGTIMSNVAAHDDFLKLIKLDHEDASQNFLSFIYRAGKSKQPNHSLRIAVKDHLIME